MVFVRSHVFEELSSAFDLFADVEVSDVDVFCPVGSSFFVRDFDARLVVFEDCRWGLKVDSHFGKKQLEPSDDFRNGACGDKFGFGGGLGDDRLFLRSPSNWCSGEFDDVSGG